MAWVSHNPIDSEAFDERDAYTGVRDQDRPPYDGSIQREILMFLGEAHTVNDVALAMQGTWGRYNRKNAHNWLKFLRKMQKVKVLGRVWTEKRRLATVYQRVMD